MTARPDRSDTVSWTISQPVLPVRALLAALLVVGVAVPVAAMPAGAAAPADPTVLTEDALAASVRTVGGAIAPGDAVRVEGRIVALEEVVDGLDGGSGVPATFALRTRAADGTVLGRSGPHVAGPDGAFSVRLPGSMTSGVELAPGEVATLAVDVIDATFGGRAGDVVGSAALTAAAATDELVLEASFVSSTGWVQPGDGFPFRLAVSNATGSEVSGASVSATAPPGVRFLDAEVLGDAGTASVTSDTLTWDIGTVTAGEPEAPTVATLVVQAEAMSTADDPRIVWKDLSVPATLSADGQDDTTTSTHGPKVIPPGGGFETARYGDKPFPIVPVDYLDRSHDPEHTGELLSEIVNSPDVAGSTFNLYQEMSYGQLFPQGFVPSASLATAGWDYEPGFTFTEPELTKGTCRGVTLGPEVDAVGGTPLLPERVRDGWYQLPGTTEYYGGDYPAFTLGVGSTIDAACGETSKSVYDAAQIADPEIDYDDFDSDKDGVVDFFMMVFVGIGGNGDSQINGTPPYDNIWPHSSSLEFSYQDPDSGLAGYISDDQLTSLSGVPQCWLDEDRSQFGDCAADGGPGVDELPVYVRVGPYNVNPEEAIEAASVISHEYGHHLGLPDFYSSYETYNDWNLMARDYSQHMTVFSKQDLGWVVPDFLQPGQSVDVDAWSEIKNDTGAIHWRTPDGEPYTLSAANGDQNIHNGQTYGTKLPTTVVIDPALVEEQASLPNVFWSGRGNDFGCPPRAGHNLDVALPELADLEAGTEVTLSLKSAWDIEWDWDYGFVMVTTDGRDYTTLPSENGYTTSNVYNPNSAGCFATFDNGITGQSGTYAQGEPFVTVARNPVDPDYSAPLTFVDDAFDLTEYAGQEGVVLRFSYFTDPAFDRPGWFIDDLEVAAGEETLFASDLSDLDDLRFFPGGCGDEGRKVASTCTEGWTLLDAEDLSDADHGYYLELRDRSGFDFNGRGQSDRGDIGWFPGVLIEYTDEQHGYGNNGVPQPPPQMYLDSQPEPGFDCYGSDPIDQELGNYQCQDAAFTPAEGDSHFDDDPEDPWIDNFDDPSRESGLWTFDYGCLSLDVESMSGDTENTEELPSDLTAAAAISAGEGCVEFGYGAATADLAPQVRIQVKPARADVGQRVVFDGSRTTDDATASEDLTYAWDLGDGTDGEGQTVTHAYDEAGTYTVTLTVTDASGNVGSASATVAITADGAGGGEPLPTTGGGAALAGLLAVVGALVLRRRRPV